MRFIPVGLPAVTLFVLGSFLAPVEIHAQSTIAGVVRDTSGGVLPGVTVEAASDVLIEKTRTALTDGQGAYRIVDLRPGQYVVTFTLPGFRSVRRDGIDLPSNFTASVDGDLAVGTVEEAITVSGNAPVVDVQSGGRTQVVSRQMLDAIPSGRTFQAFAALLPGITLTNAGRTAATLDIGGARGSSQTYMVTRGLSPSNSTLFVDGMSMRPGTIGYNYFPDSMNQEISYKLNSINADVSEGGVQVNMVPKDGGNRFGGTFFASTKPSRWQTSNLTDNLISRGLTRIDHFDKIYDLDGSQGGPLKKDRVWFFTAHRRFANDLPVPDSFYPDGSPAQTSDRTWNDSVRLTYQVGPRHKVAAFWLHNGKYVDNYQLVAGTSPEAALIWKGVNYNNASIKWTSTLTNKLLIEGGPSTGSMHSRFAAKSGVEQPPFSGPWYAGASRVDLDRGTRTTAPATMSYSRPNQYHFQGSISYVTGSHQFKTGAQSTWGFVTSTTSSNAALVQQYRSGLPDSVLLQNVPVETLVRNNHNVGVYAQDSWTFKRLTINGGFRWETLNSEVAPQDSPAGRFVVARHFDRLPDLPDWHTIAPRLSAAYDLFGDGKTAIKYALNRYNEWEFTAFAAKYNPLALVSTQLRWTDLDRDDVAQGERDCRYLSAGCEIDFSTLPANFGVRALSRADPNLERPWTLEHGIQLQRQLLGGLSVSASWYRTTFKNQPLSINTLQSFSDYTPVSIFNVVDGAPLTIYNVSSAASTAIDILDTSSNAVKQQVDSISLEFNARFRGASVVGGLSTDRTLVRNCAQTDNPNALRFCDDANNDIPYRTAAKLSGTTTLWWQVRISASLNSVPGWPTGTRQTGGTSFVISRSTRYPNTCAAPCPGGALVFPGLTLPSLTVPLAPYGTIFTDRLNEVDLRISRPFRYKSVVIEPGIEGFNLLNSDAASSFRSVNFGTPSYLQVASVFPARFFGVAMTVKW